MTRNRLSAKRAGARFNHDIADFLATYVHPGVEMRHTNGALDRGDITGLFHGGDRIVVECKNSVRVNLGVWAGEAEVERIHDGALVGMIAHKRHGVGNPGLQWITMTTTDLVALLTGRRP